MRLCASGNKGRGTSWETRRNTSWETSSETSWETMGDKTPGRLTHHPAQAHQGETAGDKGRQGLGKADIPSKKETPSNTGTHVEGETRRETMGENGRQGGDKKSGRRPHHPTQVHMWGDNERQGD